MANPQHENGYTKITNELLEQIYNFSRYKFTARELCVILCLIRKTYGFNKTSDKISMSQFSRATGINQEGIRRVLLGLEAKKIVGRVRDEGGKATSISLIKDYNKWGEGHSRGGSRQGGVSDDCRGGSTLTLTKEINTKEINTFQQPSAVQQTKLADEQTTLFPETIKSSNPAQPKQTLNSSEAKKEAFVELLAYKKFMSKFKEVTGVDYIQTRYAADLHLLKKVMKQVNGLNEFSDTVDNFFKNDWAKKNNYNFGVLMRDINKYRAIPNQKTGGKKWFQD